MSLNPLEPFRIVHSSPPRLAFLANVPFPISARFITEEISFAEARGVLSRERQRCRLPGNITALALQERGITVSELGDWLEARSKPSQPATKRILLSR